jgi:DNA topoisomerase-1
MANSLLIVESPTKAKTLSRYLGKDFVVKASVGHIKDLPQKELGIDLENGFQPNYQIIRGKNKFVKELRDAVDKADAVYLGPDPDREGEAIAWHIAETIQSKKKDKPIYRVLFYELTQKAIQDALAHPSLLKESNDSKSLYEAQQARRILDRLVGYLISPVLWDKVKRGLSAGRVQSVALRLVCEREREIQQFEPEEYWTITGHFAPEPLSQEEIHLNTFAARLWQCNKKKCKIASEEEAKRLVTLLKPLEYAISKVEKKKQRRNPSPPFITSTLQQEAARKLRFSAKRTMSITQQLYEGIELGEEGAVGLITYMRTDSTRLSKEAIQSAREYIAQTWSKDLLPSKPIVYKTKKSAQDAHEAIRPTDVHRTPERMKPYLTREQLDLYTLIWKRFVASQMIPAKIAQTTIDIAAGDYVFRVTGSVIEFPGFMVLYVESEEDNGAAEKKEERLPDLTEGQILSLKELMPKQHFTQPPSRFSEAGLIKELEEQGIGRPSTYASILSTLLDREYVKLGKRRLIATELGFFINDLLVQHFPDIMNVEFTAQMESNLDEVERGQYDYLQLLKEFYRPFSDTLEAAKENMLNLKRVGWSTELKCPECERTLHIKWSRNGPFIACSGYPRCSYTSDYKRDEKGHIQLVKTEEQVTEETCEKCGRQMVLKRGRYGPFLACSGYPKCKNTRPVSMGISCPREGCDGKLVERTGKKGRPFYGCSRYPDCKLTFWDRPIKKDCPLCGSSVLLEKVNKRGDIRRVCPNSSCSYELKEDLEAFENGEGKILKG